MRLRLLLTTLLVTVSLSADVTLPAILTDHMVLQRGLPIHLWGKATPGEEVTATFRTATQATKADPLGKWSLYLSPSDAGGPFPLTIKGNNTISFNDVLVGDVWVASGQSNMEFQMRQIDNADAEIAAANYPKIRRVKVGRKPADYPLDDVTAQPWSAVTPQNASGASAVAFFFARHLQEKSSASGVPQGIIESFWGGTPVETWMSLRAIGEDPALAPITANWARAMEVYPGLLAGYEQRLARWNEAASKAKAEGQPAPPNKPGAPNPSPGGPWMPGGLYNGMIAPLVPYPIKGAIWYQGESNASPQAAHVYGAAFQAMIRDWRRAWGVGDFPFFYVQLANYKANPFWPEVREAQRQTLQLTNTGMAVTIDVGNPNDIHPKNKQDVGLRLALAARSVAYGEKLTYSGPLYRQVSREGSSLRVWFDQAGTGLVAKDGALKGFEVAGANGTFVPADAKLDGNSVIVTNATVAAPLHVRYAWADNPDSNFYNAEGLPASPFRSQR